MTRMGGKSRKGHRKNFFNTMKLRDVELLKDDGRDKLITDLATQITEAEGDDIEATEKLKKYPFFIKKRVR